MNQIHVSRGSEQLGIMSLEEIRQKIAAGSLDPAACLVWYEGCAQWFPLSQLPGVTPSPDVTGGLIPYKNVPALVAYYCGIFGILGWFFPILGLLPAGLSLGFGIYGLRKATKTPEVKGKVHAWIGIGSGIVGFLIQGLFILMFLGAVSR